jgi:hypothetical protein
VENRLSGKLALRFSSPDDLCNLLDNGFQTTGTVAAGGQSSTASADRTQTCDNYRKLFESFDALGDKLGGTLNMEYRYTLHSITVAPDKKSALVDVSYVMIMGGSMNIKSRATETIIRKNGRSRMLHSEGFGSVGGDR